MAKIHIPIVVTAGFVHAEKLARTVEHARADRRVDPVHVLNALVVANSHAGHAVSVAADPLTVALPVSGVSTGLVSNCLNSKRKGETCASASVHRHAAQSGAHDIARACTKYATECRPCNTTHGQRRAVRYANAHTKKAPAVSGTISREAKTAHT